MNKRGQSALKSIGKASELLLLPLHSLANQMKSKKGEREREFKRANSGTAVKHNAHNTMPYCD